MDLLNLLQICSFPLVCIGVFVSSNFFFAHNLSFDIFTFCDENNHFFAYKIVVWLSFKTWKNWGSEQSYWDNFVSLKTKIKFLHTKNMDKTFFIFKPITLYVSKIYIAQENVARMNYRACKKLLMKVSSKQPAAHQRFCRIYNQIIFGTLSCTTLLL